MKVANAVSTWVALPLQQTRAAHQKHLSKRRKMGKKEKSFDPNQAFRKEQKKQEAKKV